MNTKEKLILWQKGEREGQGQGMEIVKGLTEYGGDSGKMG